MVHLKIFTAFSLVNINWAVVFIQISVVDIGDTKQLQLDPAHRKPIQGEQSLHIPILLCDLGNHKIVYKV